MIREKWWRSAFSKKEMVIISGVWGQAFLLATNQNSEKALDEIKTLSKSEAKKKTNSVFMAFPKPENDKEDGWDGVQPETFKSLLFQISSTISELSVLAAITLMMQSRRNNHDTSKDSDGLVNWEGNCNKVRRLNLQAPLQAIANLVAESGIDSKSFQELSDIWEIEKINEELVGSELTVDDWVLLKSVAQTPAELLAKIESNRLAWKAVANYVPKSLAIVLQDPGSWNEFTSFKKMLKIVSEIKDGLEADVHAANIASIFGKTLSDKQVLEFVEKNDKAKLITLQSPIKDPLPAELLTFIAGIGYEEAAALAKLPRDHIGIYAKLPNNKRENFSFALETVKDVDLAYKLVQYNVSNERWANYADLMNEAKRRVDLKDVFESGRKILIESKGYRAFIAPKTSSEALLCGEATDCCMTPNGGGWPCLKGGVLAENQAIFVIQKDTRVIAQSWIWFSKSGKVSAVCFDSLETVHKDDNHLIDFFKMMSKFAKELTSVLGLSFCWFGEKDVFSEWRGDGDDDEYYNEDSDTYLEDKVYEKFLTQVSFSDIADKLETKRSSIEKVLDYSEFKYSDAKTGGGEIAIISSTNAL